MKSFVLFASLAFATAAGLAACEDDHHDDGGHTTPPECEPIAEGCHESTTAAGMACHENAHDVWTAAECTANLAMCQMECGFGGTPDAAPVEPDAGDQADAAPASDAAR